MSTIRRAIAVVTGAFTGGRRRASSGVGSSAFAGARWGRILGAWLAGIWSADYEIRSELRTLRARARELERNNDYVSGYFESLADNVVGAHGIRLHPQIAGVAAGKRKLHTKTNTAIKAAWKLWCEPENASADAHDSMIDLERMAIKTVGRDGEAFFRRLRGFDNAFGYALEPIDADLVDETYNVGPDGNGEEIRMGVHVNRHGRPLGYYIWTRHPADLTGGPRERKYVPASEIIHLFVRYRAGQTRGVTWLAPCLTSMHMLSKGLEAELIATAISAAKMGFITTKSDEVYTAPGGNPEARRDMQVEPGLIEELDPGQDFKQFDPQHPNANLAGFTAVVLRGIARCLGISYLTLTGDLSAANYSSMRAGLLPERDHFRALQVWFTVSFHRLVYRDWVSMATLSGALKVDARLSTDLWDVLWQPRGWAWIDPMKDMQSAKLAIDLALDDRHSLAAERGKDWEATVLTQAEENAFASEHGVYIRGAPQPTPQEQPGDPSASTVMGDYEDHPALAAAA